MMDRPWSATALSPVAPSRKVTPRARPAFCARALALALLSCEWEVIVQGDEGPFGGVAQVVDCHGVTVGHQEREEEEVEQQVESDGEKTLKERCACPWMG